MKRMIILSLILTSFSISVKANENKNNEIYLTIDSAEVIFVKNNLQLLAQHFNIESQKGLLYQSKLFANPNLNYSQGPLKKTIVPGGNQTSSFNNNSEISYTISQLITTAGKRYNQIKIAENNVQISQEQYFDLLRTLKFSLRSDMINIYYLEQSITAYSKQKVLIEGIMAQYEPQVQKQNISKKEFVRMNAELLSINAQLNDLNNQLIDTELDLSNILGIKNSIIHTVIKEDTLFNNKSYSYNIEDLTNKAFENRPDLKLTALSNTLNNYNYKLQKSLAVPDINVFTSYDKQGSYVNNLMSAGISIDLPIFNRNKGNIISSRNQIEQSKVITQDVSLRIENQITNAVKKIVEQKKLLQMALQSNSAEYANVYDQVFENFKRRNISTLEFLDFLNAYLDHQNNIINAKSNYLTSIENLNFNIGTDYKNN